MQSYSSCFHWTRTYAHCIAEVLQNTGIYIFPQLFSVQLMSQGSASQESESGMSLLNSTVWLLHDIAYFLLWNTVTSREMTPKGRYFKGNINCYFNPLESIAGVWSPFLHPCEVSKKLPRFPCYIWGMRLMQPDWFRKFSLFIFLPKRIGKSFSSTDLIVDG